MILGITIYENDSSKVVIYTNKSQELIRNKNYIRNKLGKPKFNRLLKD